MLAQLHRRWAGRAHVRWPWLRPVGAAAELVEQLYARVWPELAARPDLTPPVRMLGERMVGKVVASERMIGAAGASRL